MNKNTIMLVIIFLLLGIIGGLVLSNNITNKSVAVPTGTVTYSGIEPTTIEIGKLNINNLNKVVIQEDKVVCYIKVGQGAGISCIPMPEKE